MPDTRADGRGLALAASGAAWLSMNSHLTLRLSGDHAQGKPTARGEHPRENPLRPLPARTCRDGIRRTADPHPQETA
jgi:hypothetical protein